MKTRKTKICWLELIAVQVAPSLASELVARLLDISEAINLEIDTFAQVYMKPGPASEASLHLFHSTPCTGKPSPLGLRIANQISELGSIAHSVWEPKTTTSLIEEERE